MSALEIADIIGIISFALSGFLIAVHCKLELSDLVDDEASLITIVELAIEQVEFAPPLFQIVPVPVSVTMLVPSVRDRTLELFEE